MRAKGHVFKYGDNVDTDVIIPARYLNSFDAQELASHAMVDIDPDFVKKVKPGDRLRLFQRARSALPENSRSKLHYRRDFCQNLLPQCDQYRTPDHRMS